MEKSDGVGTKEAASILYLLSLIKLANMALSAYRNIYNAPSSANEDTRLQLLNTSLECLQDWKSSMPEKMKSENCGDDSPFWLHRQCACLLLCTVSARVELTPRVQYYSLNLVSAFSTFVVRESGRYRICLCGYRDRHHASH